MQLDTLLNQDERISKELESLSVTGTRTTKNMIAIPINNTILYVESIYQVSLNETIDDLVTEIIKANTNLENSSNNNDWEMIGKDLKKLQELINKLETLKEEEDKQAKENNTVNTVNINENTIINN